MTKELKIPFALFNNKLIHIDDKSIKKEEIYTCIECDQELIIKEGEINRKHFSHKSNISTCNNNVGSLGESYYHKICKLWLASNLSKWKVTFRCKKCSDSLYEEYYKEWIPHIESSIDNFVKDINKKFIPDITLTQNEELRFIEICHTNPKTKDEIENMLTVKNSKVIEIKTDEIILEIEKHIENKISIFNGIIIYSKGTNHKYYQNVKN